MIKSTVVRYAYRLNVALRALGFDRFPFLSSLVNPAEAEGLVRHLLLRDQDLLINIDGQKMYISAGETEIIHAYLLRPYEPFTSELFKRSLKPGATVLDIGAHYGYFSLIAAREVGERGKVYAFEPAPENFAYLTRNIELNGYTNIRPINKAVGNRCTVMTLYLAERASFLHGFQPHPHSSTKASISVECVTIDEFLAGEPVDVIKMDIEGSEPYALEGMKGTLSKSKPLALFTEVNPACLARFGVKPTDFLTQLRDLGFESQLVDEENRCLRPVTKEFLREAEKSLDSWGNPNLCCLKK